MLGLILLIVLIGVGLYFLNTYVPMAAPIKTIVNIVVVIFIILILLQAFGLLSGGLWHGQRVFN